MVEIKNLEKAADRVLKAIKKREKIILYGDADLDGVSSVIILKETIKNLGGEVTAVYFPDRETEGYGITKKGLGELKKFTPSLLIVLDLGISNFQEVKLAKKMGFEVIIIDHHEVLDELPEAGIIVDPKQEGDKYSFKGLANTGIVFKLSEVLLSRSSKSSALLSPQSKPRQMTKGLRENFLQLTALATIADMMPREDDNLEFINLGLKSLEKSWRPGIRAFFTLAPDFEADLSQKISKIISLLNVRDVEDNLPASFRLLDSSSIEESKKLIEKLILKSRFRKEKIDRIVVEVEIRIKENDVPIIFEGDAGWDFTLISSVASVVCHRYQKPSFIFKILKKESQGTVRTPKETDSVALMKKCRKYLLTYGGHPQASGFRIKNENLEKFKQCLLANYRQIKS
ncbi:MAG TPA: DHH family phosphoesterase [Candidatus Humimicrobiaceae bacterium]|nr:DHH family phosphoesterase [Candidatus Humimicrobiaceae bacterium]